MKYKAFHKLSYGLYIIATELEDKKYGYIGNTAFQITSEPSQIAISSHKDNFSTDKIIGSGKFSISVLKKEVNTSLIGEFGFMSGAEFDKFRNELLFKIIAIKDKCWEYEKEGRLIKNGSGGQLENAN